MRSNAFAISSCDQPSTSYSQTTARVTGESFASARSRSMRSDVRLSASAGPRPAFLGPGLERDARAMPGRAKRHQATADGDAAYPDPEGRFAAEIVEVLEHGDQGVLQEVFGHGPLRHQPPDDAERGRRHALEQRAARGGIARSRGAKLVVRDLDFRESLHFLWLRCRPRQKGRKPAGSAWLYFRPRAGMAELVDAADSKSVALKRRVGSIPSPGTNYADELLQQLWHPSRPQSSGRGPPAAPRLRELRDHPLPESEDRRRQRAGVRGAHPALQAWHRAAAGLSGPSPAGSWRTTRRSRPAPRAKRRKRR